jgi:hypothetical protein
VIEILRRTLCGADFYLRDMNKRLLIVLAVVCSMVIVGCGEDRVSDDSKPAPAPNYKMIPAKGQSN